MMDTQETGTKRNSRFAIQLALLGLILVGLPAGSWYYLQKGLDYRLAVKNELKELGTLSPMAFDLLSGQELEFKRIENKVVVVGFFLDPNHSDSPQNAAFLSQLHQQFNQRDDVLFLVYGDSGKVEDFRPLMENSGLDSDPEQIFQLAGGTDPGLLKQQYHVGTGELQNTFVLIDPENQVRRTYDVRQTKELKLLVEHITYLFPQQAEKDLIFKRDSEK